MCLVTLLEVAMNKKEEGQFVSKNGNLINNISYNSLAFIGKILALARYEETESGEKEKP